MNRKELVTHLIQGIGVLLAMLFFWFMAIIQDVRADTPGSMISGSETRTVVDQEFEVIIGEDPISKAQVARLVKIGDQYYECRVNRCKIRIELSGVFWNGSDLRTLVEQAISAETDASFADMQAWMTETTIPSQSMYLNATEKLQMCEAAKQTYDAQLQQRDEKITYQRDLLYIERNRANNTQFVLQIAVGIMFIGILAREGGASLFKGAFRMIREKSHR